MAGIERASDMKKCDMTEGRVLANGIIRKNIKFMILDFKDLGWETVYDYGSDVRFDKNINVNDTVKLNIMDEYSAKWVKIENGK